MSDPVPPADQPPDGAAADPAATDGARSGSAHGADDDGGGRDGGGGDPAAGPALARAVLDAAKARFPAPRRQRSTAARDAAELRRARGAAWSGAGPDGRDPQPFGAVLASLVRSRGWQRPAAEARLFGDWEKVVGEDVADHCRPVKLEAGELTVEANSTAWATQLRLLAASLLRKIAAEVGHNVVTRLHIHGPAAPTWNRGPRRVRGRGPRDTYG